MAEYVFLLMPFRHGVERAGAAVLSGETNDDRRAQLRMVLEQLDQREASLNASISLIQRFRKQTYRTLNGAGALCCSTRYIRVILPSL